MAIVSFENLKFAEVKETAGEGKVRANLYRLFYFYISKNDLESIGNYRIKRDGSIDFHNIGESRARKKLELLTAKNIKSLKNSLNGKNAVYVHKNSGIPLIGNISFGIVDRNTSIIEIRPVTGCNLNCIYCSVGEGLTSKAGNDFVVELDYILEEFRKLVRFKDTDNIEAHIGTQGEPFLYSGIVELVEGLAKTPNVSVVSVDTNGTLLNEKLIDELADAGLTRINLSINAMDEKKAKEIAGAGYNIKHVTKMAEYAAKKIDLIIAPVWLQGINDKEIPKIIEFAKKIMPKTKQDRLFIGIQNFLEYPHGRNPVKQLGYKSFYKKLAELEKNHNIRLIMDWEKDFKMRPAKKLEKPFDKGNIIKASVVCEGRYNGEKIAVSEGRTITIPGCHKTGNVKVKITKSKHNIFYGRISG